MCQRHFQNGPLLRRSPAQRIARLRTFFPTNSLSYRRREFVAKKCCEDGGPFVSAKVARFWSAVHKMLRLSSGKHRLISKLIFLSELAMLWMTVISR